jgi:hypothetical protein
MHRQQIARVAGTILALLMAPLAAVICGWGYAADSPIVILDGSLTMESAVPWNQFTGAGDVKAHPETTKAVASVTITMPGKNQVVTFNGQRCTVDITYASTDIRFTTGNTGKGLQVRPFSAFQPGANPNHLAHKNQNAKISHVTVTKDGVQAFDSAASGGTKVVISYQ